MVLCSPVHKFAQSNAQRCTKSKHLIIADELQGAFVQHQAEVLLAKQCYDGVRTNAAEELRNRKILKVLVATSKHDPETRPYIIQDDKHLP